MAKKDALFRLIKSLDKSEKGYFKKYASMYSGNRSQNYIKLFDEIDSQKAYDEKKIRAKFRGEKLLNNLSVAKNYLTDSIIRSLKFAKASENAYHQISGYLTNARILFKKGLFEERQTFLDKARGLAIQTEEYTLLTEIIGEEILTHIQNPFKGDFSKVNTLLKERREIYAKLDNFDEIQIQYYRLFALRLKSHILDPIERQELEEIVGHPLLSDVENCLSLKAKGMFYLVWQYYYDFKENEEEAYQYAKRYLQLLRDNPDFTKRRDAQNHIFGLYNFLNKSRDAKHYHEFPAALAELSQIKPKYYALQIFLFELSIENELIYIVHGNKPELTETCLARMDKGHQKFKGNLRSNSLQEHFYLVTIIRMIEGRFDEALDWNLKTLEISKEEGTRPDLELSARLLNMIIHLELGNTYYLSNSTRSLKRFLDKKQKSLPVEKVVLKNLDRLSTAPDKESVENILVTMFSDVVDVLASTLSDDHTLKHFDVKTWIESKLQHCTMAELYSKNN